MAQGKVSKSKFRSRRRLTLLASVAGVGIAVLVGGSAYHHPNLPAWSASAQAAETAQRPAGFADLVAKVKPAVISVRVRIDQGSNTASSDQKGNLPSQPGAPLDRFFRQFGLPNMPNGVQPR